MIEVDDYYVLATDGLSPEEIADFFADQTETADIEEIETLLAECDPLGGETWHEPRQR